MNWLMFVMNSKSNQNSQNQEHPEQEQTNNDNDPENGFKLPAPDRDNVTALTDHLPNNPIIPWHNYDSPWEEEENHESQPPSEQE